MQADQPVFDTARLIRIQFLFRSLPPSLASAEVLILMQDVPVEASSRQDS